MSRYEDLIDLLRNCKAINSEIILAEIADEMEKADARIQELRDEAEIARKFYDVAVQQRNAAWHEVEGLKRDLANIRSEVGTWRSKYENEYDRADLFYDELGNICDALGISIHESHKAAGEIRTLLAFARRDGPLFRHKGGTLYQEFERGRPGRAYVAGEILKEFPEDFPMLVTDDLAQDEEYVAYRNAKGEYFARPARLFDEPDRFKRLV